MSPPQSNDHLTRREISGPRPAPLNINKDSRIIHKSSSPSLAISINKQQQQRHPVIIYTHSPKIIRTEACDFMALVQKLTGMSQSDDTIESKPVKVEKNPLDGNHIGAGIISPSPEESHAVGGIHVSSSSVSSVLDVPNQSTFFPDVPLFMPNSTEFLCPSGHYYRYPDSVFSIANMATSMSSPVMEVRKPFPEYLD